jgi:hypothetical protein
MTGATEPLDSCRTEPSDRIQKSKDTRPRRGSSDVRANEGLTTAKPISGCHAYARGGLPTKEQHNSATPKPPP